MAEDKIAPQNHDNAQESAAAKVAAAPVGPPAQVVDGVDATDVKKAAEEDNP